MNNRHACTATHCITSATRRSGWIPTSQLSALLHPADPDLQPHVGVAQVRPKTVLRWGNHHIQRHPPDHTVTRRGEALLQVPSPNAKQTKARKKKKSVHNPARLGLPLAHSVPREKSRYDNRRSRISADTLIKSTTANSNEKKKKKKIPMQ